MIDETNRNPGKWSTRFPWWAVVVIVTILAILVPALLYFIDHKGGKVITTDLLKGYEIYIKTDVDGETIAVTDEHLRQEIMSLCKEISSYRELNVLHDILLGDSSKSKWCFDYQIFILAGNHGYSISWLNWDYYEDPVFRSWRILREKKDEPVAILLRITFDNEIAQDEKLGYLETYFSRDSMNSESGAGWYSVISAEKKEMLTDLISLVNCNMNLNN